MPVTCGSCSNNITTKQKAVSCNECELSFHINCVRDVENADTWTCEKCNQPSLRDILTEIREVRKQNSDMKDSIGKCQESIVDIFKYLENQNGQIKQCSERIEALETKCVDLERKNEELKQKLCNQEQNSRLNSIEIIGVPVVKDENLLSVLYRISSAINFKLESSMLDSYYRLKKNPNKPNDPPVIFVKFVSTVSKAEFIKAKTVKRTLWLKDIDGTLLNNSHNNPVYINHSLTIENKILFSQCTKFKKEKKIKYLWVKYGKIHMRRDDNSTVFTIAKSSDLNDVH